ncbi:hypothetical protein [Paenibacillus campi]|uniref:hypothetical protein n=1 Tax=Paenibacillus campi TaxID=3106031 RepID=UPI002B0039D6|nr:hypothetical protein [Paenibacillus sp. SGZ-1009]
MMNEQYNRPIWNTLERQQRQQLLAQLQAQLPTGFTLDRLETFNRYGQTTETGVFTYQGSEFVFVPGDTVTLGLDRLPSELDQATREDLEAGLSELDLKLDEADSIISPQMSPVRQAQIAPLVVERQTHAVGWIRYAPEQLDPEEDDDILEHLERFQTSTYRSLEVDQTCLLERDGDQVKLYVFNDAEDVQEWIDYDLTPPFSLLTEDEWEYVYGGGCRTLFPWGDSFDYTLKLRHFHKSTDGTEHDDRPYDLELPNAFGLHFTGDPYRYELTVNADGQDIDKGGDGGNAICGGIGIMLGYLPVATYYRNPYQNELDWSERIGYMQYRRVIRL